jgi:hypothetical protein
MDRDEWTELDHLTACLSELHSQQAVAAKDRHGLLQHEITKIHARRAQVVAHLTRRLVHHVAT